MPNKRPNSPINRKPKPKDSRRPRFKHTRIRVRNRREILPVERQSRYARGVLPDGPVRVRPGLRVAVEELNGEAGVLEGGGRVERDGGGGGAV